MSHGARSSSVPSPVSTLEAAHYYAGLRTTSTGPVLICRTGCKVWELPRGPEAYFRKKELKVVGDHDIVNVWEAGLADEVHAALRSSQINWSSTDIVRIGYADEHSGDVILWIGIRPDSALSFGVAIEAALYCKTIVAAHGITDVEVEMREADVFQLAGPKYLPPGGDIEIEPTAEVRMALSATLGMPMCSRLTPSVEGSGGFYTTDGHRLFLITARHVLFPPDKDDNQHFEHNADSPRKDILLLSDSSFQKYLALIEKRIDRQARIAHDQQTLLDNCRAKTDAGIMPDARQVKLAQDRLAAATEAKVALLEFQQLVTREWASEESRIIGHIVYASPIAVAAGPEHYTRDVAVIEMDLSKFSSQPGNFAGNSIDLGFEFSSIVLEDKMRGDNVKNGECFTWPYDRLLRLSGVVSREEIRKPSMVDRDGSPCMVVLKRGGTTGLTVGCANNVVSYRRHHLGHSEGEQISKELAILPYDRKSAPFADHGDSGAVIVNGAGQLCGLVTGGSGSTDDIDITYATPIEFVLEAIKGCSKLANVRIDVPGNLTLYDVWQADFSS